MSRSEQKTLKDRSKQLVFFYVDVIVVLILKMIIGEVIQNLKDVLREFEKLKKCNDSLKEDVVEL